MRNRTRARQEGRRQVTNLAGGEVEHSPPPLALEAACNAITEKATHLYGGGFGQLALREAVAARLVGAGAEVEAGQVVVTIGAKQALFDTCLAVLDPGDEVLVPVPSWPTYTEGVSLSGGVPVAVRTTPEMSFKVSVELLEASRTRATKAVLIGTPSNPTGSVYSKGELSQIAAWALTHGLWLIVDEVYDELLYGDQRIQSILSLVPELAGHCVVIDSIAKRWAMPGWRVGWLIGCEEVVSAVGRIHSHTISHVPNVCQAAARGAILEGASTVNSLRGMLAGNRELSCRRIEQIDGVSCSSPDGALYVFANVEELLQELPPERGGGTSADLVEYLFEEYDLALVEGDTFGAPGYVRLSFGGRPADLARGLDMLEAFAATA